MDNKKRGRRRAAGGFRKHQEIEQVKVEENFQLHSAQNQQKAGDAVYVSVVNNNRRMYGVLIEQSALSQASELFFKDQAESLELNRRMKVLLEKREKEKKDNPEAAENGNQSKRAKTDSENQHGFQSTSLPATIREQPIQKFKYVHGNETQMNVRPSERTSDYRILLATFCDVREASNGNPANEEKILTACEEGGNFVGPYYYQYEVMPAALTSQQSRSSEFEMRTSMGFHSFLQNTMLPSWFPLSNLQSGSHKFLSMLNMKRDSSGNVVYDKHSVAETDAALSGGTRMPMQPRGHRYEICVIGGGIAGLAASQELIMLLEEDGIDARVTLLEGRERLGGRLWTDQSMSKDVPIEMGAQWIHGIDDNPLAALCKQANIDFVTASEEVTMLGSNCERIDTEVDENMGKLFDDLLDHAADDCWGSDAGGGQSDPHDAQAAVKWYSSVFLAGQKDEQMNSQDGRSRGLPKPMGVPVHRKSSDRSVDFEIAKAISKHKLRDFSKLGDREHHLLLWNTKNVEYALGANVSDLSMKFWDSDERHAFEGDHVLLRQGYSSVVQHMIETLEKAGKDRFNYVLDYPVGKIEYARKSDTKQYGRDSLGRNRKLVELSDTCSVTRQDGQDTLYFDFLVCTLPLGVLKESVVRAEEENSDKVSFQPSLPFSKIDSITNVGFGLLDKVFLRFERPFWRKQSEIFNEDRQCLFGNLTGENAHHYMFFDVGKCLGTSEENAPAILMSLISGKEAVACELLSDEELVAEVMETLGSIFSNESLPSPMAHRITRWGQDKFSRGSYTFLPPGATDQDFQLLQSPINGNGDSLWIEGSETMRLFFAGEHTTALHPSMAHGAMLSGIRAAKEIVSTLQFKSSVQKDVDRIIPESLFRHKNPATLFQCSLCHKTGGQLREGRLIAFKRGARQVLCHNNCAEFSPEVEVVDSKWKHVIKAVNRGKALTCSLCHTNGATIGCTSENCFRVFHFSCAEDSGWRFDRDGKVYYCDLHRRVGDQAKDHSDRISLQFFATKNPPSSMVCSFCQSPGDADELFAYQSGSKQVCVHRRCLVYSNNASIIEIENSRTGNEYTNVFPSIETAKVCTSCARPGASVLCTDSSCGQAFHVKCAESSGWKFESKGRLFLCKKHRDPKSKNRNNGSKESLEGGSATNADGLVMHNLLAQFGAVSRESRVDIPSNESMGGTLAPTEVDENRSLVDIGSEYSEEALTDEQRLLNVALAANIQGSRYLIRIERASRNDAWNLSLSVETKCQPLNFLVVAFTKKGDSVGLQSGDRIKSFNGRLVGEGDLQTLRDVMELLKEEVSLMIEVVREPEN